MANNVNVGPNAVVANASGSFASAGITSSNTAIIYLVQDPLQSYVPGRAINGISAFVANKGYYIVALTAMDLTAYVVPPTSGGGGGSYTFTNTEAADYFTRLNTAGYASNNTEKAAYDNFVGAAKSSGYFTKLKGLYLFVGNNDATRLINAISSSFTGVKHGGAVLSASGAAFNGTDAYVDTQLSPTSSLTVDDTAFGAWIIESTSEAALYPMGCADAGSSGNGMLFIPRNTSDNKFGTTHYNNAVPNNVLVTNSDASGFYISSRTSHTLLTAYRNGTSLGTATSATSSGLPAPSIFLGAVNVTGSGAVLFSAHSMKMAFISSGLTSADAAAFNTALGTLITALGR